jgi:hypothetical protein
MSNAFKTALTRALARDYNEPNIFNYGVKAIQWPKKVVYFDP